MKKKSDFKNIVKILKQAYKLSPENMRCTILATFISSAKNIITILMPLLLLTVIENAKHFLEIIGIVFLYAFIITIANMTEKYFSLKLTALGYGASNRATFHIGKKGMRLDYKHWESAESLEQNYKAVTSGWIFMGISDVIFENLLKAVLSIIVVSYIVIKVNFFVWLVIFLLVGLEIFINRKYSLAIHDVDMEIAKENKKLSYDKKVLSDLQYGKEIRLYHSSNFLCDKFQKESQTVLKLEKKKQWLHMKNSFLTTILFFAETVLIYFFAIKQYASGILSIGYFLTFLNAIREFSSSLVALLQVNVDLAEINDYYENYDAYMQLSEEMRKSQNVLKDEKEWELRFKNVSFCYPNSDVVVLKNLNFSIHSGEKIALVGENGSGKTTLIKLLLRLYDVTEGEILLNGVNIKEYEYESYIKIFSPIFQDFQLHAYSIKENISFLDKENEEKIWSLLKENELETIIRDCPKQLDTYVSKLLEEDGREFSGGEKQKLAMVRAQYKEGKIFVLDEPTSAIDPIAEVKFFQRVNQMIKSQTAVFVSHRMASTKFANKIIVLQNGVVEEIGTYEELIKANGIYAQMFHLQSIYYT